MATKLLLASVGAGKTAHILNHLVQTLEDRPFARVWALLATKRQEDSFRQRLVEWASDRHIFFNIEFFNFYELNERILDIAGQPQRELSEPARRALLREIFQSLRPDLMVLGTIIDKPGLVQIVGDFIYELKQNRILPEDFQVVANHRRYEIDHDLALIYAAYQQWLQNYDLVDKEGQGWLAVDALYEDESLAGDLALLLVDGFDQFSRVQADLLTLLADRSEEALITLTTIPGREKTAGRRFIRAIERIEERYGQPLERVFLSRNDDDRHPDLQHAINALFARRTAHQPSSGGVAFIEAPDPADEVAAVLRQVKGLLLDGVSPDEIMIALRDWEKYRIHLGNFAHKYKLPLALHYGQPLTENPAIVAFLNLLNLHELKFRRRELLEVLRSPYFFIPEFNPEAIKIIETLSYEHAIIGEREIWLETFDALINRQNVESQLDDDADSQARTAIDTSMLLQVRTALEDFFDRVTPPGGGSIDEFIKWIEDLIGTDPLGNPDEEGIPLEIDRSFRVIECVRAEGVDSEIVTRDLMALHEFKKALRGLLNARELLNTIQGASSPWMPWEVFYDELLITISTAVINPRPNRYGRVLVTTAADARGLPHEYLFILGLSEGIFPARIPEDPLYLDSERLAIRELGLLLDTRSERAADDGLFYELICLPRKKLTLSRPTMQEGKPWLESPLWRAMVQVFSDADELIRASRLPIGHALAPEQAATTDEVVIGLADQMNAGLNSDTTSWFLKNKSWYWAHIYHNRAMELRRMSDMHHDHYSGRLQDQRLVELVREKLNPARLWSASQMNDYGVCGFRFFAGRLLKLEAVQEPQAGMDVMQSGTLNHTILERTYRQIRDSGITIEPDHTEFALNTLHEIAQEEFRKAPHILGFRPAPWWDQEKIIMLRKLHKFVEVDFSTESPIRKKFGQHVRQPYRLELEFGFSKQAVILPLENETIRVRGVIDRIDRIGDELIVIDYKSGSGRIPISEMEEGRNFQMMLYLEAARRLLAQSGERLPIAGGAFLHLSNQQISGETYLPQNAESIEQAKLHLQRYLDLARQGDFAAAPPKLDEGRCIHYCEFYQMCRVSIMNRWKP